MDALLRVSCNVGFQTNTYTTFQFLFEPSSDTDAFFCRTVAMDGCLVGPCA